MKKTVIYAIWVVAIIMLLLGFFMGFAGWSQTITKSYRASDFMPMAVTGTVSDTGAGGITSTNLITGTDRLVSHAGTGGITGTYFVAGADGPGNAVANTNRAFRYRRTAGQSIGHGFSGHRIHSADLDPLDIIVHLAQIHRAADDLQIRQADEQNTLTHRDRDLRTVSGHGNYGWIIL